MLGRVRATRSGTPKGSAPWRRAVSLAALSALLLARTRSVASDASAARPPGAGEPPAPQRTVETMLRIDWSRGPNLPQGLQDSDGGFIGTSLVSACGFCSGGLPEDQRRKPGRYPRGFLQKAWALDVAAADSRWTALPPFPGAARQGLAAVLVGDRLCFWGGFSYSEPFCYRDGWQLSSRGGRWSWQPLPSLPWPLAACGLCAVGPRIYAFGGADYDGVKGFFTECDRAGRHPRLGARLLALDLHAPAPAWQRLPDCPGTPRFVHAVQAVGGRILVIGGATGDVVRDGKAYGYCTVVDNWTFDPQAASWIRLRDLPVSSGNFPKSTNLVYADRYVILPGGHQYAWVANPDGTLRPRYGKASQKRPESGLHNDVFVYDVKSGLYGKADALPIDNNLPMSVVRGDRIYLVGGETGGGVVEGEYYGHHPDLLLVGRIRPLR
jgi:N-acetylneuraminic acid mutarotase